MILYCSPHYYYLFVCCVVLVYGELRCLLTVGCRDIWDLIVVHVLVLVAVEVTVGDVGNYLPCYYVDWDLDWV